MESPHSETAYSMPHFPSVTLYVNGWVNSVRLSQRPAFRQETRATSHRTSLSSRWADDARVVLRLTLTIAFASVNSGMREPAELSTRAYSTFARVTWPSFVRLYHEPLPGTKARSLRRPAVRRDLKDASWRARARQEPFLRPLWGGPHTRTRPTRATHYDADTTMKRTEPTTNIAPWSVIMRNSAAKQLY